jgi:KUP system potassium uptake protein
VLLFVVARQYWRWSLPVALAVISPLLLIDSAFLAANMLKFFSGGFIPVLLAAFLILLMLTWVRGSRTLQEQSFHQNTTLTSLLKNLHSHPVTRVDGIAFYLTSSMEYAPSALLQNLKHNKVLHDHNVLLTLRFENRPHVPDTERLEHQDINKDFTRLIMKFGFMDSPNVITGLRLWRAQGEKCDLDITSFFISRRNIVPSKHFGMPVWRDRLYIAMANHASDAADYFRLPPSRVVELGVQMTV